MDDTWSRTVTRIQGNAAENYRPKTCLPLMWMVLTGVIAEKMYELLSEEQKRCRRGSRVTKDQLLINKPVFKYCKKRYTNLSMAWID